MSDNGAVPAISVVMPAYNTERYVDEAVSSILAQTFTDWELVAIDDHSTDNTKRILDSYAASDPRIRVVTTVGKGFVDALRTGVEASHGGLIARMDSDDRSAPTRLERQWEFLQAHPEVGLLGTSVRVIDSEGVTLSAIRYPSSDAIIRLALRHETTFAHGAVVMNRHALLAVGGHRHDAYPADDYELWCRLVTSGVRAANLDEPLYDYRVNDTGISRTQTAEQIAMARAVGRSYGNTLADRPTLREIRDELMELSRRVSSGEVDPRALRRAAQSLQAGSGAWLRNSPSSMIRCLVGAMIAEVRFRRSS